MSLVSINRYSARESAAVICAAVLLLAAGCERAPKAAASKAPPIRGELINSAAKASERSGSAAITTGNSAASSTNSAVAGATGSFQDVGFEKLSGYKFEVTDEIMSPPSNHVADATAKTDGQIPAAVKAFDQKEIALKGFMLPLKVDGGLVTELLIMRDQSMCCYGAVPKINEWVSVKMKSKGVRPVMDQPVTLCGKLHVGEMRENGYLVGIYSMDGEKMVGPED